jgi:hypothetical protein
MLLDVGEALLDRRDEGRSAGEMAMQCRLDPFLAAGGAQPPIHDDIRDKE